MQRLVLLETVCTRSAESKNQLVFDTMHKNWQS